MNTHVLDNDNRTQIKPQCVFESPLKVVAVVLAVACGAGCISVSEYHTARTIDDGDTEIGVVMEASGEARSGHSGMYIDTPQLRVRQGASEEFDFGLRAGSYGLGADVNYMFYETREREFFSALSFSPAIQYYGTHFIERSDDDNGAMASMLAAESGGGAVQGGGGGGMPGVDGDTRQFGYYGTFLVDFYEQPDRVTVTGGFKAGGVAVSSGVEDGDTEHESFIGGSLALKLYVDGIYLMPEFNLVRGFDDARTRYWTGGVGILF